LTVRVISSACCSAPATCSVSVVASVSQGTSILVHFDEFSFLDQIFNLFFKRLQQSEIRVEKKTETSDIMRAS
jgi:hypothetical protein